MNSRPFDWLTGIVLDPDASPDAPSAKATYRDYGTAPIRTRDYGSNEAAALEWEKLWTKIWTLAGFVCDIPHVGDYFRYDLGAESFLIVRSETDRSEEHTSELQSLMRISYAVFCLKKKK